MNFELNIDGVSVDEIGIKTDRTDFTEQELDAILKCAGSGRTASQWVVADTAALLDYKMYSGQAHKKGNKGKCVYSHISSVTGYRPLTISMYARTARTIPHDMRRKELTFAHHVRVASFYKDKKDIQKWLDMACHDNLTVDIMLKLIREDKGIIRTAADKKAVMKTVEYLWHKRNAIKRLHNDVDRLDFNEVVDAMGVLEPYFKAFQTVMGRLLFLQNAVDGQQDDNITKAVVKAQRQRTVKGN